MLLAAPLVYGMGVLLASRAQDLGGRWRFSRRDAEFRGEMLLTEHALMACVADPNSALRGPRLPLALSTDRIVI